MKKNNVICLILSLLLAMQCIAMPAMATEETTQPEETAPPSVTEPQAKAAFGTVCINEGCRTIDGMKPLGGSDRKLDTAAAAFVYEVQTGTVVYGYNPDMKVSPGTLAKLVLALVVIENGNLDDIVTCVDGIQSYVPGSSQKLSPSLKSGEQVPMRDLLYGLVMTYANDAAVALAQHVFKTTDAAKAAMNQRVKQMGCVATEFGNISGLDTATSTSTAREVAKIMVEVRKNPTLLEIMETDGYDIEPTNLTEKTRKLQSGNYLQDDHILTKYYDKRVTSGMASATDLSGASIACNVSYNNMELVFVTLGSIRTFSEETGTPEVYGNFDDCLELIKYVCNNFKINRIIYEDMAVCQWPVIGGECEAVGRSTVNVDSVVPAGAAMNNLIFNYTVENGGLTAPVKRDSLLATVEVWYQNSCLTEVELYAMADVRPASDTGVTIRSTAVTTDADGVGFLNVVGTICVVILGLVGVYLAYNSYIRTRVRAQRRKRRQDRRRSR